MTDAQIHDYVVGSLRSRQAQSERNAEWHRQKPCDTPEARLAADVDASDCDRVAAAYGRAATILEREFAAKEPGTEAAGHERETSPSRSPTA